MPRNPNSEPWWNWPDRWEIAEEWSQGVSLNRLGIKYHHDRGQIAQWIDALDMTRPNNKQPKPIVIKEPKLKQKPTKAPKRSASIRELCLALVYAEDKLGRPPRYSEIEGVMKVLAQEGVFFGTRIRESVAD